MSAIAIAVACVVAGVAASAYAWALAERSQHNARALDDSRGPQKIHRRPIPRIGGVALAVGLFSALCAQYALGGEVAGLLLLFACIIPGFAWGLIEDVSKRGAVFARLVLTGMTPTLAYVFLDARIVAVDVPILDELLQVHALSFVFTVFAVTGLAHAMNVIDGLNGLCGVTGFFAAIGLALVALACGDMFVFTAAVIVAASIAGFLRINYPHGRLFLGDGGAYLIGLLLAELGVLLVHGNPEVSAWFPLVLLAYPIWETLFSMYRRRRRGASTGAPDALHLHSLVYRRVVRWWGYRGRESDRVTRNSLASLYLWTLPALCLLAAVALWNDTEELQAAAAAFAVLYVFLYRRIVRFGVPRWLVLRRSRRPAVGRLGRRWDDEPLGAKTGRGQ